MPPFGTMFAINTPIILYRPAARNLYPSATSSAIITLNPNAKHSVPTLECRPWDISGIKTP